MFQVATPLIQPTCESSKAEADAPPATAPLLTQGLEDHRLAERIERALHATGYGALRTIQVSVNARCVILEGRVSSYYLKQVAQATALAVPGGHQIRNGLDVVQWDSDRREAGDVREPQSKLSSRQGSRHRAGRPRSGHGTAVLYQGSRDGLSRESFSTRFTAA